MKHYIVIAIFFAVVLSFQSCSKKDDPTKNETRQPKVSISNGQAYEGDILTFAVTLDTISADTVSFYFIANDGTATSDDYFGEYIKTKVTIPPGSMSTGIVELTKKDDLTEDSETFKIVFSDPKNCTLLVSEATGTILNKAGQTQSSYYMTAKINGNAWTAMIGGFFGAELLFSGIPAYGTDGDSQMAFNFGETPASAKTYTTGDFGDLDENGVAASYTPHFFTSGGLGTTYFGEPLKGEFKITEYDATNKTITGTFSFTGKEDGGTEIAITDGVFKIPFEE